MKFAAVIEYIEDRETVEAARPAHSSEESGGMVRMSCVARGCGLSALTTRGKRRTHPKAHFEFTRHSF